MFDLGIVYRTGNQHFLAIQRQRLLTAGEGGFWELEPQAGVEYKPAYRITVGELCQRWGISTDELDQRLRGYFALEPNEVIMSR